MHLVAFHRCSYQLENDIRMDKNWTQIPAEEEEDNTHMAKFDLNILNLFLC